MPIHFDDDTYADFSRRHSLLRSLPLPAVTGARAPRLTARFRGDT